MQTTEYFTKELDYDPETGIFEWLPTKTKRSVLGIAGTINQYGYTQINFRGKSYMAHRLAWFITHGEWPNYMDHANHVKTDNRIKNLRNVSPMESSRNIRLLKRNKAGVTGIFWDNSQQSWVAFIYVKGKRIHLGSGKDLFEMVCKRKAAEIKYGFHPNHGS